MSEYAQTEAQGRDLESISSIKNRLLRLLVARLSDHLTEGRLALTLPHGKQLPVLGRQDKPSAQVSIHQPRVARRILFAGALGMADSYIDGDWDTDDLTSVIEFGARNVDAFDAAVTPLSALRALSRLHHRRRANTRSGSRRNIAAHYDLGNSFYSHWLDPTMTYSSACFDDPSDTLEAAQIRKFERLATQLDLQDGDHILEIGCGWGGFAMHAARERGCRVTALTVSPAQAKWAREKIADAGLSDRIEIRLQDYRDVDGTFDKIASIEMFEAVGERYWPTFFRVVADRLRAGGRAALQVITIDENRYQSYRRNPDFIQMRIFPGGMLPTGAVFAAQAGAAGLTVRDRDMFGRDYAETLRRWGVAFEAAWNDVSQMDFDERFRRLWRYYLSYCEAGFRAGNISVGQFRLEHAQSTL